MCVVTQVYTYGKIHQVVHLRSVHFTHIILCVSCRGTRREGEGHWHLLNACCMLGAGWICFSFYSPNEHPIGPRHSLGSEGRAVNKKIRVLACVMLAADGGDTIRVVVSPVIKVKWKQCQVVQKKRTVLIWEESRAFLRKWHGNSDLKDQEKITSREGRRASYAKGQAGEKALW